MENRRLITFMILSVATLWIWTELIIPKFFPAPKKPAQEVAESVDQPAGKDGDSQENTDTPKDGDAANAGAAAATTSPDGTTPDSAAADKTAEQPAKPETVEHPSIEIRLGSQDPKNGYALEVELTSLGAGIQGVWLADPKFTDLIDHTKPARIIGNNFTEDCSFTTAVDLIDRQLLASDRGRTLESVNWKLDQQTESPDGMTAQFSYDAPDGSVRIEKVFHLPRLKASTGSTNDVFRADPSAHTIQVEIRAINLSEQKQELTYELQGPVGVLLENEEHTSKYRDIKIEFIGGGDDVTRTAPEVIGYYDDLQEEAEEDRAAINERKAQAGEKTVGLRGTLSREEYFSGLREHHKWTGVYRYAGIDVQFFAALVAPLDDRSAEERQAARWIDRTFPVLIDRDRVESRKSDISFRMASTPLILAPKGGADTIAHKYAFFVGPKRRELLDPQPLAASRVLDYGSWFGFVARAMHWVLDLFHSWGMPYVLAIISLTIMVRGMMFPLSRKQALSAAKMKDLQPKLAELKLKFGDDKEKMARAQMELWRKHNINPLGGCLPLFVQMPIFIGLYTSLNTAIDLRLASFLWIDNLAAPDAIFRLPVMLPYLGRDFSILPCLTVVLFVTQQKLFMPPATDEQQEMTQKMMNYMTIFFGFMFWHQPAGLCVYFIASSLWGIAERLMLTRTSSATSSAIADSSVDDILAGESGGEKTPKVVVVKPSGQRGDHPERKVPGFMQKLMDMAQEAKENAEKTRQDDSAGKKKKRKN